MALVVVASRRDVEQAAEKPPLYSGFLRLRDEDSNLDYLIQSQASYH